MADRKINYEAVSCMIKDHPYSITGKATLLVTVKTKQGHYHHLSIGGINVHQARCIRDTIGKLCEEYKEFARQLWAQL